MGRVRRQRKPGLKQMRLNPGDNCGHYQGVGTFIHWQVRAQSQGKSTDRLGTYVPWASWGWSLIRAYLGGETSGLGFSCTQHIPPEE